ncbi:hypothetical protein U3516DRAFT_868630 [Neocallimastix sp. 'constans']
MKFKYLLLFIEIIFHFINVINSSPFTQGLFENYLIHLMYYSRDDNGERIYEPEFYGNEGNKIVKTDVLKYKILPSIESKNGNVEVKMTENYIFDRERLYENKNFGNVDGGNDSSFIKQMVPEVNIYVPVKLISVDNKEEKYVLLPNNYFQEDRVRKGNFYVELEGKEYRVDLNEAVYKNVELKPVEALDSINDYYINKFYDSCSAIDQDLKNKNIFYTKEAYSKLLNINNNDIDKYTNLDIEFQDNATFEKIDENGDIIKPNPKDLDIGFDEESEEVYIQDETKLVRTIKVKDFITSFWTTKFLKIDSQKKVLHTTNSEYNKENIFSKLLNTERIPKVTIDEKDENQQDISNTYYDLENLNDQKFFTMKMKYNSDMENNKKNNAKNLKPFDLNNLFANEDLGSLEELNSEINAEIETIKSTIKEISNKIKNSNDNIEKNELTEMEKKLEEKKKKYVKFSYIIMKEIINSPGITENRKNTVESDLNALKNEYKSDLDNIDKNSDVLIDSNFSNNIITISKDMNQINRLLKPNGRAEANDLKVKIERKLKSDGNSLVLLEKYENFGNIIEQKYTKEEIQVIDNFLKKYDIYHKLSGRLNNLGPTEVTTLNEIKNYIIPNKNEISGTIDEASLKDFIDNNNNLDVQKLLSELPKYSNSNSNNNAENIKKKIKLYITYHYFNSKEKNTFNLEKTKTQEKLSLHRIFK